MTRGVSSAADDARVTLARRVCVAALLREHFLEGQRAVVAGDLMRHQIQCREPDWSAKPDWDAKLSAVSRRKFFASVADTDTLILPIHFPAPTVGLIKPLGAAFDYRFKREEGDRTLL